MFGLKKQCEWLMLALSIAWALIAMKILVPGAVSPALIFTAICAAFLMLPFSTVILRSINFRLADDQHKLRELRFWSVLVGLVSCAAVASF